MERQPLDNSRSDALQQEAIRSKRLPVARSVFSTGGSFIQGRAKDSCSCFALAGREDPQICLFALSCGHVFHRLRFWTQRRGYAAPCVTSCAT